MNTVQSNMMILSYDKRIEQDQPPWAYPLYVIRVEGVTSAYFCGELTSIERAMIDIANKYGDTPRLELMDYNHKVDYVGMDDKEELYQLFIQASEETTPWVVVWEMTNHGPERYVLM